MLIHVQKKKNHATLNTRKGEEKNTKKDGQDGCELRYELKNPQLSSKVSTKFDKHCCCPQRMTLANFTLNEGVTL